MSKTAYPLKISDSLKKTAARLAAQDGVSLNHWINIAVAQKIGAVETEEALRERYGASQPGDLSGVLDKVRDNDPDPGDEVDLDENAALLRTARGTAFSCTARGGDGYSIVTDNGEEITISGEHVRLAMDVIRKHARIRLGASFDKPVADSLGAKLQARFIVNYATYIAPILAERGLCKLEPHSGDGGGFDVVRV